jgi:hypothetical protein
MENDSLLSNSLGVAHFRQAEVSRSYGYHIRCEGYQDVEGSFFLTTDTTLEISMTELTKHETNFTQTIEPVFWPNPAKQEIFFKIPDDYSGVILKINDLKGKNLLVKEIHQKEEEIGIDKLVKGMYILQLISDSGVRSFVLVKE